MCLRMASRTSGVLLRSPDLGLPRCGLECPCGTLKLYRGGPVCPWVTLEVVTCAPVLPLKGGPVTLGYPKWPSDESAQLERWTEVPRCSVVPNDAQPYGCPTGLLPPDVQVGPKIGIPQMHLGTIGGISPVDLGIIWGTPGVIWGPLAFCGSVCICTCKHVPDRLYM